jgi:hypothetical protein
MVIEKKSCSGCVGVAVRTQIDESGRKILKRTGNTVQGAEAGAAPAGTVPSRHDVTDCR